MAVYNSSAGLLNQDDSDITIINPSIIDEHNNEDVRTTYVPIITRLKQANNSSENRQIHANENTRAHGNEYIIVDHDPLENAKNLEDFLMAYIRDLKQEKNTQLDCDKQLVTRLMDSIRSAYVNNQPKMIELDKIMGEIGVLHDRRHMEQKEKIEHLRTEICQLNKMLFTASNDHSLYNENHNNATSSIFTTIHRGHSINDYDQWTEIEDDAKKLHEIVQSQRNQINEIVTLISQTATAQASLDTANTTNNQSEAIITDQPSTPTPSTSIMSTLLQRIIHITEKKTDTQQQTVTTPPPANRILENHSPGISPTNSMATLTLKTLTPTTIQQQQPLPNPDNQQRQQEPIPVDIPHVPIEIPVTPVSPIIPPESKKCPVCNHEFALTSNDVDMYDHIEKCLFPTGIAAQPKDYECPNCNRKYPGNQEVEYLHHLSDCYNREL